MQTPKSVLHNSFKIISFEKIYSCVIRKNDKLLTLMETMDHNKDKIKLSFIIYKVLQK